MAVPWTEVKDSKYLATKMSVTLIMEMNEDTPLKYPSYNAFESIFKRLAEPESAAPQVAAWFTWFLREAKDIYYLEVSNKETAQYGPTKVYKLQCPAYLLSRVTGGSQLDYTSLIGSKVMTEKDRGIPVRTLYITGGGTSFRVINEETANQFIINDNAVRLPGECKVDGGSIIWS
uniref:Matrix protein n=1 Tax=Rice stripe mosaic virus TaxID=1931356 RepID=A0A3G6VA17_9RHAB|nr:matrix protein [Rice stripe mosaic virus]AZB50421.1 matrix protein [Rice stripe mosaic virus]AZB50428.1 matrix protein [Rice stripe mosaic virus]AZB50435.1 matrix protein [Rice stripe mosaic virus]AZB50442.1 matrix protein [Rice stripe mosaic virus]